MGKKVRYNGETKVSFPWQSPNILKLGGVYEVIGIFDWRGECSLYQLKGVAGKFPSLWFEEVPEDEAREIAYKAIRCAGYPVKKDMLQEIPSDYHGVHVYAAVIERGAMVVCSILSGSSRINLVKL